MRITNSVTTLETYVFADCTGLKDVTVEWSTPLTIFDSDNIFIDVNTSAATLHVPMDTEALYGVAPVWKEFGTIVEYDYTANANIATPTVYIVTSGEQTVKAIVF